MGHTEGPSGAICALSPLHACNWGLTCSSCTLTTHTPFPCCIPCSDLLRFPCSGCMLQVANQGATTGKEWVQLFRQHNSGT